MITGDSVAQLWHEQHQQYRNGARDHETTFNNRDRHG
jgi:hypothetical protein